MATKHENQNKESVEYKHTASFGGRQRVTTFLPMFSIIFIPYHSTPCSGVTRRVCGGGGGGDHAEDGTAAALKHPRAPETTSNQCGGRSQFH